MYSIIETKERVLADNDAAAEKTRSYMKQNKIFFVNLMGSPGAGKTSVLIRTIRSLKEKYRIGVMEADVDSDVDAATVSAEGVRVIQLHSGGLCHMDADMAARGLEAFGPDGLDLVFLENIGNLVCPAEFDVGSAVRVMILSVPEGDDKPLKYPLMFTVSDCCLVNKIDAKEVFDFDDEAFSAAARKRNPNISIIPVSALTGEGFDEWIGWLENRMKEWKDQA